MPTVAEIILIAKATEVISERKAANGALFNNGNVDVMRPYLVNRVRKSVEWMYQKDPNYPSLLQTALYLYGLCSLEAAGYVVDNGGVIPPINPPSMPLPNKIEFNVDGSSFIPTNGNAVTLPVGWAGFGMIFTRGNVPQTSVTTESTYFTWNTVTRQMTIVPNAQPGELFSINPV